MTMREGTGQQGLAAPPSCSDATDGQVHPVGYSSGARRLTEAAASTDGSLVPCEVLLLVLAQLPVASCVSAGGVCRHWQAVVHDSDELWLELYRALGALSRSIAMPCHQMCLGTPGAGIWDGWRVHAHI